MIQIMGNVWLILVLTTPMIVLGILPESTPEKNFKFVDGINSNPALLPSKEYRDSLAYFITLLLVMITAWIVIHISRTYILKLVWFTPTAIAAIVFSLANSIVPDSRLREVNSGYYFESLSTEDLFCSSLLFIVVALVFLVRHRLVDLVFQIVTVVLSISCLVSFVVLTTTNTDITNSQLVINELLSATSGLNPMFSFSSQYSSGLPYLVQIISLFNRSSPYSITAMLLTSLSVVILAGCVFVICKLTTNLTTRLFSFLLVMASIAYTTPNGGRLTGYLQGFPIRTLIPVLLAVIVCKFGSRNRDKAEFSLGIFGVCLILINFDFGLAAYFALLCVVLVDKFSFGIERVSQIIASVVRFLTPLLLGIVALRIAQISTPSTCNFVCTGEFSYLFGGTGFFAVTEPTFGIQQAILCSAVVGLLIGIVEYIRIDRSVHYVSPRLLTCRLLVSLSTFLVLSFPYYVNRSYAALLVQFFLPWTAILLLLVRLITISPMHIARSRAISALLIGVLMIAPLSNLRHLPPVDDVSNLVFDASISTNFRIASEWSELPSIIDKIVLDFDVTRNQIGLVSRNAMPDAITNGVLPAIPYNSPASIVLKSQQKFACEFLLGSNLKVLVVRTDSKSSDLRQVLDCAEFQNYTTMTDYVIARKN
jgi:hypothetical protein